MVTHRPCCGPRSDKVVKCDARRTDLAGIASGAEEPPVMLREQSEANAGTGGFHAEPEADSPVSGRCDQRPSTPSGVSPAENLVDLLCDDQVEAAFDLVIRHRDRVGDPQRTCRMLLEPAARLLGDLWSSDRRDFVEVTLIASQLQRFFLRLADEHPPSGAGEPGRRILLAMVPGEQHDFGLTVVEDAFVRDGWWVERLYAPTAADIIRSLEAGGHTVLGLSLASECLVDAVRGLVTRIRHQFRNKSPMIIVGGNIVLHKGKALLSAGCDAVAADLDEMLARLASGQTDEKAGIPMGSRSRAQERKSA